RSGLESVSRAGDAMTRVASSGRDHAGAVENSVATTRETVRAVASATEVASIEPPAFAPLALNPS
ncbi:MAG: hypothetical protein ACNA8P_08570, partial [Phycisphaerales bacterium]